MLADELKQLFDRSMRANAQIVARAGGVLKEAAQAARDPQRLSGKDARALLGELVKLQLDYLAQLSQSSTQYLGAVVSLAESAVAARPAATDTAAQATALSGRVGETLVFQFQIDNPNPQPVSAAIELQDWTSRSGSSVGQDSLVCEPAAAVVPAHELSTVQGRIAIDERFVPGQTYDTLIRVAGFPGRQVALSLSIVG
ncbi:MAG: hypothetical protein JSR38_06200 [Proteobacteria bacterium]|uniref:hypothetical protein n=1 Tax=Piscinibacter sp. TaxID=1903157 RepID=UPI001B4896A1|nr:hypothetical protein [Piscinibacter sp.]MBP5989575.1 hypothetical protein [Piscinibacter sp.]MBP6029469.1 hypothetical protein [Piscinibacter sp.]MBS0441520.1 hypothetical protein [Pseudomonadota bacterium]